MAGAGLPLPAGLTWEELAALYYGRRRIADARADQLAKAIARATLGG